MVSLTESSRADSPGLDEATLIARITEEANHEEVELEERFLVARADATHVVLDDADAANVACLAQALEDLLRAVRVSLQQANDAGLERIELAVAWH